MEKNRYEKLNYVKNLRNDLVTGLKYDHTNAKGVLFFIDEETGETVIYDPEIENIFWPESAPIKNW